jgi:hypothetical protein
MSENTPLARPKNYGWAYFFAFIIVASVGVAGFMIWFNLSIQLKPDQLEAATKLWKEKGPKNYDMTYTKQLNDDTRVDKFEVKVRGGKVEEVRMNGRPLVRQSEDAGDPLPYHSMDRLLSDIERNMDIDQKAGAPKVYVTAVFEPENGALRKYIRRVMGSKTRVEINVTLKPVDK